MLNRKNIFFAFCLFLLARPGYSAEAVKDNRFKAVESLSVSDLNFNPPYSIDLLVSKEPPAMIRVECDGPLGRTLGATISPGKSFDSSHALYVTLQKFSKAKDCETRKAEILGTVSPSNPIYIDVGYDGSAQVLSAYGAAGGGGDRAFPSTGGAK